MDELLTGLRAAGEPTRLRLLALLAHSELTVTELTQILGQSQPRVSRHLKLLTESGLVDRFREGTWAFYRLAEDGAGANLGRLLVGLLPGDDLTLRRDRERLNAVRAARAAAAAAYFEENAENWDQIRSLYVEEDAVEARMREMLGQGPIGDLVDVGTGTGRMLQIFAPRITRGVGIDLSPDMLRVARANLEGERFRRCQVRHGDMYSLNLPDESFDVAVIHQVLHFAENPGAVLDEAARVLRPGGRLLIADFAPHHLEFLREEHKHRRLGFADQEVRQWAAAAGLAAKRTEHLPSRELTVALWLLEKPAAARSTRERFEEAV